MYRSYFNGDLLDELTRLQRQFQRNTGGTPNIRGFGRSEFPPLNIAGTPDSIEIHAFAPGLDPASIDVTIERGVLTISGERKSELPADAKSGSIHINERFAGRYSRAVSLTDDADPSRVTARYIDGVLHISVKRRESTQPRRIQIQ